MGEDVTRKCEEIDAVHKELAASHEDEKRIAETLGEEVQKHARTCEELAEERAIVNRIWAIYDNPSCESLHGKSIYDLIEADHKAAGELAATRADNEAVDALYIEAKVEHGKTLNELLQMAHTLEAAEQDCERYKQEWKKAKAEIERLKAENDALWKQKGTP